MPACCNADIIIVCVSLAIHTMLRCRLKVRVPGEIFFSRTMHNCLHFLNEKRGLLSEAVSYAMIIADTTAHLNITAACAFTVDAKF